MTDIPHHLDDSATPTGCHQADLMSAFETIWASPEHPDENGYGGFWIFTKVAPSVEYRRADLPRPEDAKRIRELEAALIVAEKLLHAATELAQLASYSAIVGGISVNREFISKWCDVVFDLRRSLPENENFDPSFAAIASLKGTTHE